MRVVLDTNVVLSGIFFGGLPGRVLEAWSDGAYQLVLSPALIQEYTRVVEYLGRRHPARAEAAGPILTLMTLNAILVDAPTLPDAVSRDPDDDRILAAARAGGAMVVVSGDRDLLDVSGWEGIAVLSPREFVGSFLGRTDS